MPQPNVSDVHVDVALTQFSIAFAQGADQFISGAMFPEVPVAKQTDKFFIFSRRDWLRSEARVRAASSESAGSGFNISQDTYSADVLAVHKDIDDRVRANQDAPLDMNRSASEWTTEQMLLKRDLEWAAAFFTTGVWTGSTTGGDIVPGTKWDAGGSDPIGDIKEQIRAVHRKTGKKPNKFAVSPDVWDVLSEHPTILDRIKFTQRAILTTELFASLIELAEVHVANAVVDASEEGAANDDMQFLAEQSALLVHTPSSPALETPSAGYTISWTGLPGASGVNPVISNIRLEKIKSDRIEGEMAFVHKATATELGAFFATVLT